MSKDLSAIDVMGPVRPSPDTQGRGERPACAISASAAKVIDTTRRAWQETTAEAPKEAAGRPPRAAQPKKRVVPRRSRWPSLVAALNYWSPKPL